MSSYPAPSSSLSTSAGATGFRSQTSSLCHPHGSEFQCAKSNTGNNDDSKRGIWRNNRKEMRHIVSPTTSSSSSPAAASPCSFHTVNSHPFSTTHRPHKLVHTAGFRGLSPSFSAFPLHHGRPRRALLPPSVPANFFPPSAVHRVDSNGNEHIHVGPFRFPLFSHPFFRHALATNALVRDTVESVLNPNDNRSITCTSPNDSSGAGAAALRRVLDHIVDTLVKEGVSEVSLEDVEELLHAHSSALDLLRPSLPPTNGEKGQASSPHPRWTRFPVFYSPSSTSGMLGDPLDHDGGSRSSSVAVLTSGPLGGEQNSAGGRGQGNEPERNSEGKNFYNFSTILERTSANIQQQQQQQQKELLMTKKRKKKSKQEKKDTSPFMMRGVSCRDKEEHHFGVHHEPPCRMSKPGSSTAGRCDRIRLSTSKEYEGGGGGGVPRIQKDDANRDQNQVTEHDVGKHWETSYSSRIFGIRGGARHRETMASSALTAMEETIPPSHATTTMTEIMPPNSGRGRESTDVAGDEASNILPLESAKHVVSSPPSLSHPGKQEEEHDKNISKTSFSPPSGASNRNSPGEPTGTSGGGYRRISSPNPFLTLGTFSAPLLTGVNASTRSATTASVTEGGSMWKEGMRTPLPRGSGDIPKGSGRTGTHQCTTPISVYSHHNDDPRPRHDDDGGATTAFYLPPALIGPSVELVAESQLGKSQDSRDKEKEREIKNFSHFPLRVNGNPEEGLEKKPSHRRSVEERYSMSSSTFSLPSFSFCNVSPQPRIQLEEKEIKEEKVVPSQPTSPVQKNQRKDSCIGAEGKSGEHKEKAKLDDDPRPHPSDNEDDEGEHPQRAHHRDERVAEEGTQEDMSFLQESANDDAGGGGGGVVPLLSYCLAHPLPHPALRHSSPSSSSSLALSKEEMMMTMNEKEKEVGCDPCTKGGREEGRASPSEGNGLEIERHPCPLAATLSNTPAPLPFAEERKGMGDRSSRRAWSTGMPTASSSASAATNTTITAKSAITAATLPLASTQMTSPFSSSSDLSFPTSHVVHRTGALSFRYQTIDGEEFSIAQLPQSSGSLLRDDDHHHSSSSSSSSFTKMIAEEGQTGMGMMILPRKKKKASTRRGGEEEASRKRKDGMTREAWEESNSEKIERTEPSASPIKEEKKSYATSTDTRSMVPTATTNVNTTTRGTRMMRTTTVTHSHIGTEEKEKNGEALPSSTFSHPTTTTTMRIATATRPPRSPHAALRIRDVPPLPRVYHLDDRHIIHLSSSPPSPPLSFSPSGVAIQQQYFYPRIPVARKYRAGKGGDREGRRTLHGEIFSTLSKHSSCSSSRSSEVLRDASSSQHHPIDHYPPRQSSTSFSPSERPGEERREVQYSSPSPPLSTPSPSPPVSSAPFSFGLLHGEATHPTMATSLSTGRINIEKKKTNENDDVRDAGGRPLPLNPTSPASSRATSGRAPHSVSEASSALQGSCEVLTSSASSQLTIKTPSSVSRFSSLAPSQKEKDKGKALIISTEREFGYPKENREKNKEGRTTNSISTGVEESKKGVGSTSLPTHANDKANSRGGAPPPPPVSKWKRRMMMRHGHPLRQTSILKKGGGLPHLLPSSTSGCLGKQKASSSSFSYSSPSGVDGPLCASHPRAAVVDAGAKHRRGGVGLSTAKTLSWGEEVGGGEARRRTAPHHPHHKGNTNRAAEDVEYLMPTGISLQELMTTFPPSIDNKGLAASLAPTKAPIPPVLAEDTGGGGRVMGAIDSGYGASLVLHRSPGLSSVPTTSSFPPLKTSRYHETPFGSDNPARKVSGNAVSFSCSSFTSSPLSFASPAPLPFPHRHATYPDGKSEVGSKLAQGRCTNSEMNKEVRHRIEEHTEEEEEEDMPDAWGQGIRIAVYSLLHQRLEIMERIPLKDVRRREKGLQVIHALDAATLHQLHPPVYGTLDASMDGSTGHLLHVRPRPVLKPPTEGFGPGGGVGRGIGDDGSVGQPALLPMQISKLWQHAQAQLNRERGTRIGW